MNSSLQIELLQIAPKGTSVRLTLLPFLLLAVPLAEIATFVIVGSKIGVVATIALVLVTAVTGATLLRIQGLGTLDRIRTQMDRGEMPGRDLVHGLMIMIAGVFLLTPGFITDTLGLLLFVPSIRERAWRFLRERVLFTVRATSRSGGSWRGDGRRTIDLDSEEFSRNDRPSSR
jgi:UPF0716 protein FxsA